MVKFKNLITDLFYLYRNVLITCLFNLKNIFILSIFVFFLFNIGNIFLFQDDYIYTINKNLLLKKYFNDPSITNISDAITKEHKVKAVNEIEKENKSLKLYILWKIKISQDFKRFILLPVFLVVMINLVKTKKLKLFHPEIDSKSYQQLFKNLPKNLLDKFYNFANQDSDKVSILQLPILPIMYITNVYISFGFFFKTKNSLSIIFNKISLKINMFYHRYKIRKIIGLELLNYVKKKIIKLFVPFNTWLNNKISINKIKETQNLKKVKQNLLAGEIAKQELSLLAKDFQNKVGNKAKML